MPASKKPNEISEERLQQSLYCWFHNSYPELRGLLCYNFNNSRNGAEGNKNKSMGLQPGRSDLVFYYKNKAYMIELKTLKGRQSDEQKNWEAQITAQGFVYHLIRTEEEFKKIITTILS